MGLRMNSVVPVDTHVIKLTAENYLSTLKTKKTIGKELYRKIGAIWFSTFGEYAGWAHSVLFSSKLHSFTRTRNKLFAEKSVKKPKTQCPLMIFIVAHKFKANSAGLTSLHPFQHK
ncbi:unnamed protein product [Enterobius vermicularis]|uniref:DNA-(apurinic or apyrimidinic site) lyase n=1 Tax=Enterobius vermicularis TaxID=51028 RepID=A0A0N4UW15_ENTVE|nr:unnamed protein product [Enterobius vermicularis]